MLNAPIAKEGAASPLLIVLDAVSAPQKSSSPTVAASYIAK
jgi:hypothetical protein